MPTRSVCLMMLSPVKQGPGRSGRQLPFHRLFILFIFSFRLLRVYSFYQVPRWTQPYQPHTATGAPSQTSTIPCHTIQLQTHSTITCHTHQFSTFSSVQTPAQTPTEPRETPHVTVPSTRSWVQHILCRGSKPPGNSGMNFSECSGAPTAHAECGYTQDAHLDLCLRTHLSHLSFAGAAKCRGRPLLHEHEVAVQTATNLATVHPRLARTALERSVS